MTTSRSFRPIHYFASALVISEISERLHLVHMCLTEWFPVGHLCINQLGPAGVMVEVADHDGHVTVAGLADRLAVVHGGQDGHQTGVLL